MAPRIYLVRHAQSEWQRCPNEEKDTPLSVVGREQALRLGRWLERRPHLDPDTRIQVTSLCTSPYLRARQTGGYVERELRLSASTWPCLREADFHVAAHLPRSQAPLEPIPPIEASVEYTEFKQQVCYALERLVREAEALETTVMAITHGGLIKTMLRLLSGADVLSAKLYNTGVTAFEWGSGRWHLVHLNLCEHLPPELRTR